MIWYKASHYSVAIEQVEVIRETDKFVVRKRKYFDNFIEQRELKGNEYFPTLELAKQAIRTRLKDQIRFAEQSIERAQRDLVALTEITDENCKKLS